MKLTNILLELRAAEEAKQKGLTAAPFGRWRDRTGKIVARTEGDKLIPVKAGEAAADNSDMKPTGMSAKTAGKAPSNAIDTKSVEKANGDNAKDDGAPDNLSGVETPEETPPIVKNVYRSSLEGFGQPTTIADIKKLNLPDDYGFLEELVIGEEVHLATPEELAKFIEGESEDEFVLRKTKTIEDAKRQHTEWRSKFPLRTRQMLAAVQSFWQGESQFHRDGSQKENINKLINAVCKGPPPAVTNMTIPIERGMRIKPAHAKEFMRAFRIGEEIDTPPSGFSASSKVARDYATAFDNIDPDKLGVVIRLSPNPSGQINGLHLAAYKGEDLEQDDPELANEIRQDAFFYQGELEIIRPSGPKARCASVKKMVVPGKQVLYVIDLEELGYENMKKPISEDMQQWDKVDNPRFLEYMNTPLGQIDTSDSIMSEIAWRIRNASI